MRFVDLTKTFRTDEDTVPLHCKSVTPKRKGGTPHWLWTFVLESVVGDGAPLPSLPQPWKDRRNKVLQAMEGGLRDSNPLDQFTIDGAITIGPMVNGAHEYQACGGAVCTVHFASIVAQENQCGVTWKLTITTADASRAHDLLELTNSTVWLEFVAAPAQPQLRMFGASGEAEDIGFEHPVTGERRSRPGGIGTLQGASNVEPVE